MTDPYDRKAFFEAVRVAVFHGLSPGQVAGCEVILAEALRRSTPRPALAYILATAFWETARAMQPIREIGQGRGKPYGTPDPETGHVYYGRGFVQLTWKANYAKLGALCGVDLVSDPDRALDPAIAVKILFEGMTRGLFTGKTLADYAHGGTLDWVNARRIINGTDQAHTIAVFARQFDAALAAAEAAAPAPAAAAPGTGPSSPTSPVAAPSPAPAPTLVSRLKALVGLR